MDIGSSNADVCVSTGTRLLATLPLHNEPFVAGYLRSFASVCCSFCVPDLCCTNTDLLEANVPGASLTDESDEDESLQFLVADINGMTGGSFWSAASRVNSPIDPGDE